MKCPIDTSVDLVMTDRSGVEIDYCPSCRGVWLDRGELDKIIERAAAAAPTPAPASAPVWRDRDDDDDDRRDGRRDRSDDDRRYEYAKPKKKKSSFLGDLFEF